MFKIKKNHSNESNTPQVGNANGSSTTIMIHHQTRPH
jgi:hypothetical protein